MSKFGLGKGLADLQVEMGKSPEISVLAGGERVSVRHIPITQIAPNPDQPRKTFDVTELDDLAASIKEKGVLQPILIRSVMNQAHQYEIVAGERRWRASKLAGLTEIPALVKSLTDENAMEIALIENVQRENLNPIEEGEAYKNLMDKCGYEMSDVSRLIGKSESYIRNIMRLEVLPESVKKMVGDGVLSASHARALAVAENPTELANEIVQRKMNVLDASKMVKEGTRSSKSRSFSSNLLSPDIVDELERKLITSLGTTVKLREKKGGKGEIAILFSNRIQMDELINKLS